MNQVYLQYRPPTPLSSFTYHGDVGETINLKMNRMQWVSAVSTQRLSDYLLKLQEAILKSQSSTVSCRNKRVRNKAVRNNNKKKKYCVIHGIMKNTNIRDFSDLSVCA